MELSDGQIARPKGEASSSPTVKGCKCKVCDPHAPGINGSKDGCKPEECGCCNASRDGNGCKVLSWTTRTLTGASRQELRRRQALQVAMDCENVNAARMQGLPDRWFLQRTFEGPIARPRGRDQFSPTVNGCKFGFWTEPPSRRNGLRNGCKQDGVRADCTAQRRGVVLANGCKTWCNASGSGRCFAA